MLSHRHTGETELFIQGLMSPSTLLQPTDDSQGDPSAFAQWELFSHARAVVSLFKAKDGLLNLP